MGELAEQGDECVGPVEERNSAERDVAPRTIRLVDVLRATAPSDPDVAAFLAQMQEGRREGPFALLAPLAEAGQLRHTLAAAADITYVLASPDTFRALVEDRSWTWTQAENWITEQLRRALFGSDEGTSRD